jgi:hypothetical protein
VREILLVEDLGGDSGSRGSAVANSLKLANAVLLFEFAYTLCVGICGGEVDWW